MKHCINLDWLQVYCHCSDFPASDRAVVAGYNFSVRKEDYPTKLWNEVYTITMYERECATICRSPRSSMIHRNSVSLKLHNRFLYCQRWLDLFNALLKSFNLEYKGITRCDICYDCNVLANGWDPGYFITQFLTSVPNTIGHIVRKGSFRFQVHGRKRPTRMPEYTSIRWGSSNNAVGAYCYNKSLELLEVKDKPWIREVWANAGLAHEWDKESWDKMEEKTREKKVEQGYSFDYVHKSVWRFEISIKSEAKDLLNLASGELFQLTPQLLQERAEALFYVYAKKVLAFSISTGQKNYRYYPELVIFDPPVSGASDIRPYYENRFADTGRSEKMCYNKLLHLSQTYSDMSPLNRDAIDLTLDFLNVLYNYKKSTVQNLRYIRALDELKGHKFIDYETMVYFGALSTAAAERRKVNSDSFSRDLSSLFAVVRYEMELEEAKSGYDPLSVVW